MRLEANDRNDSAAPARWCALCGAPPENQPGTIDGEPCPTCGDFAEPPARSISEAGRALIKSFEGLRLAAYRDSAGVPTIGYGHTGRDVHLGQHITRTEALGLLEVDLAEAERGVEAAVSAPLAQEQFDALVSLAFNIGVHAFTNSTLVHLLNAGDYASAADQFPRWCHSGGKVDPVLVRRRGLERDLFLSTPEAKP